MLDVGKDSLVKSGRVPGGIFGLHKQKVSPTGDAFSYFVSGRQVRTRDEIKAQNFLGMVLLACSIILLRLISG
ncbi:hypothetical protein HNQ04_004220 [Deinococcus radiopugnans ATCC 19172]|uniref:Uncharacterized protein n=1 Tax=Deinococcus radiopugnans ATCC 19172 TaxID=585398 RepID=A0ABR6NY06_9DEIO|nr:hypothetical protein [Deinococcus radiopugnans ATCC 19172]